MATQAQLDAMAKVRQTIASGKGDTLNARNSSTVSPATPAPNLADAAPDPMKFFAPAQSPTQPKLQTFVPSTGQTTTGQAAVDTLKSMGGSQQQVEQAQQQVTPSLPAQPKPQPKAPVGEVASTSAQQAQDKLSALNKPIEPQQQPKPNISPETASQIPQQIPADEIAQNPQAFKAFQEKAAQSGYVYDDTGKLTSSPDVPSPAMIQPPVAPISATPSVSNPITSSPNQLIAPPPTPIMSPDGKVVVNSTDSAGNISYISPEDASKNAFFGALTNQNNQSLDAGLDEIMNQPVGTTAADNLKQNLIMQLGMINDPTVNQMLDNSATRAKNSYEAGLSMVGTSLNEINSAIDGTLAAPMTAAGLQAKFAKQQGDLQQKTIQNEIEYRQKTHEAQMTPLRENRARLEGYAKAKLEAMGAADSSAGITLLSKINQSADLQIEQANLDYDHAHTQLITQGTQIMHEYQNQVSTLIQQTEGQKATYAKDFNDAMAGIDEKRLTSEQAKNQQRITAFSNYNDKITQLDKDRKQQQFDLMKFAYDKHKDLVDQSFKMSGQLGTVFIPDGNGGLKDTGIPTFDAKKNAQDYMMKVAGYNLDVDKFGLQKDQFGFDKRKFQLNYALDSQKVQLEAVQKNIATVNSILDLAKSDLDPAMKNSIEQMLLMPQGTLNQFGNDTSAMKEYIGSYGDQVDNALQQAERNEPTITSSPNFKQVFNVGGKGGQCGTWASTISTAPRVGNSWAEKRTHIDKRENPQPGDKLLVPLAVKTDAEGNQSGWGHVAVVTGFDSATGNVTVVESNVDLKGTIRTGSYNVNTLNSKYGSDWGYASGQFKPDVMNKLQSLPPEDLEQSTYIPKQKPVNTTGGLMIDFTKFKKSTEYTDKQQTTINQLHDDYSTINKEIRTLNQGFSITKNFDINTKNPNDDQALIFSFMKTLDPGSVVREGEFEYAKNLTSKFNAIANTYNLQAKGEGILSPEQRQNMLDTMKTIHNNKIAEYIPILQKAEQAGSLRGIGDPRVYMEYTTEELDPTKKQFDAKTAISEAKSLHAHPNQILAGLLGNPAYTQNINTMISHGASVDDVLNYYSQ